MRMRLVLIAACFSIYITPACAGQEEFIDSMNSELSKAAHDTVRLRLLLAMVENINDDKVWPEFNDKAYEIALKLSSSWNAQERKMGLKAQADALNNKGYLCHLRGDLPGALDYYEKSMKLQKELDSKSGVASLYNNMGFIHKVQGNYMKALECYESSLKIYEEIGHKEGIAQVSNNIGMMNSGQQNYPDALTHFRKSMAIQEEIGDKRGYGVSLNNIGTIYDFIGKLDSAMFYYQRSLKIRQDIRDMKGLGTSLNNIGLILLKQNKKEDALKYFEESLKIREEQNDKQGKSYSLNNLAQVYFEKRNLPKASAYALLSLKLANESGYLENMRNAELLLSKIDSMRGDFGSAYFHFRSYVIYRDSINNEQSRRALISSRLKYEYEKKAAEDKLKADQEKTLADARLKEEQTQRYALYGGLGITAVFGAFMFNRFRITRQQKKIIELQKEVVERQKGLVETKQKEVMDSMHYAKRIQRSLLPSDRYIDRILRKVKDS